MVGRYLGVWKGIQGVLIGGVGFLEIILHEIAMPLMGVRDRPYVSMMRRTKSAPDLPVVLLQCKYALEVLHSLGKY